MKQLFPRHLAAQIVKCLHKAVKLSQSLWPATMDISCIGWGLSVAELLSNLLLEGVIFQTDVLTTDHGLGNQNLISYFSLYLGPLENRGVSLPLNDWLTSPAPMTGPPYGIELSHPKSCFSPKK